MAVRRSRGFTLIELLVVIAIIGVLIALLLPAVQAAREAARRSQCINNLKQLGIGQHNHHDSQGSFTPGAWNSPAKTWTFYILPYLEQQAMSNALNINAPWYDIRQSTVTGAVLSVFLCPSDGNAGTPITTTVAGSTTTRRKGNYVVNWGNSHHDQNSPRPFAGPNGSVDPIRGAFRLNTSTAPAHSLRDITDGASQTMMASEVIDALSAAPKIDLRGDIWSNSRGAYHFMAYTPPNSSLRDQMDGANDCNFPFLTNPPCSAGTGSQPDYVAARSRHPGGVNVAFCDGSVKFIKDSVNINTWRALSTKDGEEVISTDQY